MAWITYYAMMPGKGLHFYLRPAISSQKGKPMTLVIVDQNKLTTYKNYSRGYILTSSYKLNCAD